jgi:hypothetical protein
VPHRVAFASCPAFFVATAPPAVVAANVPHLPLRSFHASVTRYDSGLSAQPLASVCSTWLSVNPGVPSLALTLPQSNPLHCASSLVMVPTALALSLVNLLIPATVSSFVSSTAQLCLHLRSRLHAPATLCRSMHQRSVLSPSPVDPGLPLQPDHFILPPIHGVDFTFPASTLAHSPRDALPWLLRTLDAVKLLSRTYHLRAFLLSIPCSAITDDISILTTAAHTSCSSLDWTPHFFNVFHGSPICGHFGVYKTLFRIRVRFFWPRCRQDVIDWIKECAHCILADKSVRRHSEVLFSWPVTAPMFALHCDLWSPGSAIADSGAAHLLSAMCDLTQFVVSVPVHDIHAHELTRLLFQEVLLKVGMCGLIVVDAGSTFWVFSAKLVRFLASVFMLLLVATIKLLMSNASSATSTRPSPSQARIAALT